MSRAPLTDHPRFAEVTRLAIACLADEISDAELARLNEILDGDTRARDIYLAVINDSQTLHTWAADRGQGASA